MAKKKKGKKYGRIIAMVVITILVFGLAGFAAAEQEWLPGYGDKNGRLGKDGQAWRIGYINSLVMEGPTSDGFETTIRSIEPTADNDIGFPDSSGTVALTESIGSTIALADTKLLIGQSTGLAAPFTVTGDSSITNAGVMTNDKVDNVAVDFGTATDGNIQVATNVGGGTWDSVTMSGDAGIANSGALTIVANAIGASEFNSSLVNVPIVAGQTSGTATVTSGAQEMGGAFAFANVDAEVANSTSITGTTLTVTLIAAAADDAVVFRVRILEP